MLEIPSQISAHLTSAGTVIVPTRQRAAALRLAHGASMLAAGRSVWATPDILPWTAWVERELAEARARGEPVPRRLSGLSEWLLWRELVVQASPPSLLGPERLVDSLRSAIALLEDYGLPAEADGSAEAVLLARVQGAYRERCQAEGLIGASCWRDCAAYLRPSARLLLAGFTALGPARRDWLTAHGAQLAAPAPPLPSAASVQVMALSDASAQAEAAADWCAQTLRADPQARLLVVVPRLAEQRHLWERALTQRLDYARVLAGQCGAADSPFALEGGQPLDRYPLVATALDLAALAAGPVRFERLGALLRSAYLPAAQRAERLRLERCLREEGIETVDLPTLGHLLGRLRRGVGESVLALIGHWNAQRQACETSGLPWAQRLAAWLAACGWPGDALSSDEQQVRGRFDELLGELAAADRSAWSNGSPEALSLLRQLCARVSFEPASDDVAVTVTAALEDPIVRYDGLWAADLSAERWPAPARPDPFVAVPRQRAAGVPSSSPAGQLAQARALQQAWQQAAHRVAFSWATSEEDLPADPSPLLPLEAVPIGFAPGSAPPSALTLEHWLAEAAPMLEPWREQAVPSAVPQGALPGGTRLLELQAVCPFRSFAQLRLGAEPLAEPVSGIDARRRGQIVHRALELLWRKLPDQATLLSRSDAEWLALAESCAARAVQELAAELPGALHARLLERECERTVALLRQLLAWERGREPFRIEGLEQPAPLWLAGAQLRLRLDRIDRLADGRLLVIDYKSGKPQRFEADAEPPTLPQLLAYASALGGEVAAVAALYFGREGPSASGVADRSGRLPRLRALREGAAAWPLLLQRWRKQLQALMGEYLAGGAALTPQPRACDRCHLHMLCRIDAARLANEDPAGESEGEGDEQSLAAAEEGLE